MNPRTSPTRTCPITGANPKSYSEAKREAEKGKMAPFPTPIEAILGDFRTSGLPFRSELPFGFCLTCEPMSGGGGSGIHHRLFVSGDLVVFWGVLDSFQEMHSRALFRARFNIPREGPPASGLLGPLRPFLGHSASVNLSGWSILNSPLGVNTPKW